MGVPYPKGPDSYPKKLVKASNSYRLQAWLAMMALLAFLSAYAGASAWLVWKAFILWRAAFAGGTNPILLFFSGLAAAFLAVFMIKALFFMKRGGGEEDLEVTEAEEPELFAFLHRLAKEAKAPRPRRVFLSARVNAGVFFDVSPLNLIFPSKKNLEIGLPLANALTLSEFKAVLAHEFGHFAQRSMAVGRWVYVARRIAEHIVAKRDGFDRLLDQMAYFLVAVQYTWFIPLVGWILKVIIWALRAVVDTVFRGVLLAERALSREMEFQADRIAVSLSGSDALVHALCRMNLADRAWDRTLEFANAEISKGRAMPDLFDLHSKIMQRLGEITNDPKSGAALSSITGEGQRIFQADMVQVSRMWSTHPFNHEREENAKRIYLAGELDDRSPWSLFRRPEQIRQKLCAEMIRDVKTPYEMLSKEQALSLLDEEYARESCSPEYFGSYLDRYVTRWADDLRELYGGTAVRDRSELYSERLSADLEALASLQSEKAQLEALRDGKARNSEGRLQHQGDSVRTKRQAVEALADLSRRIHALKRSLAEHDRSCRSRYYGLASEQGDEWVTLWLGLLKLLHYSEHTLANILDAEVALRNTLAMTTAKSKVSEKEFQRIFMAAGDLYHPLSEVPTSASKIVLDEETLALLGHADWASAIGEWKLGAPCSENLSGWLNVVDGWTRQVVSALHRLRRAALDRLLATERQLEEAHGSELKLGMAPRPPAVQFDYRTFTDGKERPLQRELDLWSKFHAADGWLPGAARLAVAGMILAGLVGMSSVMGTARLTVFNGLGREVIARIGTHTVKLRSGGQETLSIPVGETLEVSAETREGTLIETFSEKPSIYDGQYVYNIAGASPLVEWTAVYGPAQPLPERVLGAPRWIQSTADAILEPPPARIQTEHGEGGTRTVLAAAPDASVRSQLSMSGDEAVHQQLIRVHARWDDAASPFLAQWLGQAFALPDCEALLDARLEGNPLDIQTLRIQQELPNPDARAKACERQRRLLAGDPGNPDLQYLVARALPVETERDAAFKQGFKTFPNNGWFAYAAGSAFAEECDWPMARKAYEVAIKLPSMVEPAALELARIRRIEQGSQASVTDLLSKSGVLKVCHLMETGVGGQGDPMIEAYIALNKGDLRKVQTVSRTTGSNPARLIRLIAASDGATTAMQKSGGSLPFAEGLDEDTFWCSLGLALRSGASIEEHLKGMDAFMVSTDVPALKAFLQALMEKNLRQAEARLEGTQLVTRARAYELALIALGDQAPPAWRTFVKRALFSGERPYFS